MFEIVTDCLGSPFETNEIKGRKLSYIVHAS